MEERYPWYSVVQDQMLQQGDFLISCPVYEPKIPGGLRQDIKLQISGIIQTYDLIILSQSCDLVQGKLERVLVCPVWSMDALEGENEYFKSVKGKEEIR